MPMNLAACRDGSIDWNGWVAISGSRRLGIGFAIAVRRFVCVQWMGYEAAMESGEGPSGRHLLTDPSHFPGERLS